MAKTSMSVVRSANDTLKQSRNAVTAVFVGATSGIGRATLQAFAKHVPRPKVIIVGRSLKSFEPELRNLKSINSKGEYIFLETDISRLSNIDAICGDIKQKVDQIDLLVQSQGYLSFNGREQNADGLDNSFSLRYYGRVRFVENLLPLMSQHARVLSILAGGQEGKIFEDDLDLEQNYSLINAAGQSATMMTLSFDSFAEANPDKAFLHVFPGFINTGLLAKSATGFLSLVFRYFLDPIMGVFIKKPEEVGERMLYYVTTDSFGTGSWSLDWDGTPKETDFLKGYRQRGFAAEVVAHNRKIFQRATSQ